MDYRPEVDPAFLYDTDVPLLTRIENEIERIAEGYNRLPLRPGQSAKIFAIEQEAKKDARDLIRAVPLSRELTTLLAKIPEIVMLACSGIIINENWPLDG